MKNDKIISIPDPQPKHSNSHKSQRDLSVIIGEALGLIACMCVVAITIALTVKFIMWIL